MLSAVDAAELLGAYTFVATPLPLFTSTLTVVFSMLWVAMATPPFALAPVPLGTAVDQSAAPSEDRPSTTTAPGTGTLENGWEARTASHASLRVEQQCVHVVETSVGEESGLLVARGYACWPTRPGGVAPIPGSHEICYKMKDTAICVQLQLAVGHQRPGDGAASSPPAPHHSDALNDLAVRSIHRRRREAFPRSRDT